MTILRSDLVERAVELRARGMLYREVAAALGVSISYAGDLCRDPDGALGRARKDSYRGSCEDCGGPTDGSNGRAAAPRRCQACSHRHQSAEKLWTRDRLIDAIREWNDTYGRPPAAWDWNPQMARRRGRPDVAERFEADGCWPCTTTVQTAFGSWSAGIAAGGFTPRPRGRPRGGRVPPAVPLVGRAAT